MRDAMEDVAETFNGEIVAGALGSAELEMTWYLSANTARKAEEKVDVSTRRTDPRPRRSHREPRPRQGRGRPGPWGFMPVCRNRYLEDPFKMDLRARLSQLPLHLAKVNPKPYTQQSYPKPQTQPSLLNPQPSPLNPQP